MKFIKTDSWHVKFYRWMVRADHTPYYMDHLPKRSCLYLWQILALLFFLPVFLYSRWLEMVLFKQTFSDKSDFVGFPPSSCLVLLTIMYTFAATLIGSIAGLIGHEMGLCSNSSAVHICIGLIFSAIFPFILIIIKLGKKLCKRINICEDISWEE